MRIRKDEIVRKGYDKVAKIYDEQRDKYNSDALLLRFCRMMRKGADVLDMGCGAGVPVTKGLVSKGFKVTGIDFSKNMLALARKNVPAAKFKRMDMTKMKFKANSFDGVVSFYAIIHVPREKHSRMYKSLHRIIRPGGVFLVNAGGMDKDGWEGYEEDYLGAPMFWSYYGPEKTSKIIEDAGFRICWSKVLRLGGEKQFWVLARKRS
jgi:ubiquinone/menaquinone biosynthesis C-methylase UbiE